VSDKSAKFDWIDAVSVDRRFTHAERHVLSTCALKYVRHGQDGFTVRQVTIAQRAGCGVATVKRAIAKARRHGYLVLAAERQRGRSHHGGDRHCLVMPGEIGISLDSNRDQVRPEIGIRHDPQNTVPPAETTPLRVSRRDLEGTGGRATPPPACPRHPHSYRHNEACRACQALRRHDANKPTPTPPAYIPLGPPPVTTHIADAARLSIRAALKRPAAAK
jgi:hypothetical protein